jgi:thiol-disulfide isomerase/thioredoxin
MRRHSFTSDSARRALGVAGIVGFVALALCSDANVLTKFHTMNAAKAEDSLIGAFHPRKLAAHAALRGGFHSSLGVEGAMPDLDGAIGWLNSVPLSRKLLRGKVALVNFWTYTCINSLWPLPYLKNWAAKYNDAGLVVIGVHTPEFSFEQEPMNVENAVRNLNVSSGKKVQSWTEPSRSNSSILAFTPLTSRLVRDFEERNYRPLCLITKEVQK